ncbi:MAG: 2-C-methyl-D-erythritol 4-phosphate cytidylyltransferase [Planctomycetota bacterium]|jgi:2-C-methyl-D-erythritol 4-phosphate cytidylyltransferase
MRLSLILPAAGSGTRFGGERPKQLLDLNGEAVLIHSIRPFIDLVDEVVVATSGDLIDEITALLTAAALPCPSTVVCGGATRQESVHAALRACAASSDAVLVHDAARPLIDADTIKACIDTLADHPAAVVCEPCASTVKQVDDHGVIRATVPRDDLWLAQTPQGFDRQLGLQAFAAAAADGFIGTDDVAVLAHGGHPARVVAGPATNIKITRQADLTLAAAILRSRL